MIIGFFISRYLLGILASPYHFKITSRKAGSVSRYWWVARMTYNLPHTHGGSREPQDARSETAGTSVRWREGDCALQKRDRIVPAAGRDRDLPTFSRCFHCGGGVSVGGCRYSDEGRLRVPTVEVKGPRGCRSSTRTYLYTRAHAIAPPPPS